MEERSNNKNKVTKTRDFSQGATKKLENDKIIDRNGKRSHEKQFNKKWQNLQELK